MRDNDEITRPGTPDALRTMHEIREAVKVIRAQLTYICNSLDAIERDLRAAKAEAVLAQKRATEALGQSRFSDKRIDAIVQRIQHLERVA